MVKIHFVAYDGSKEEIACESGQTLMNAAVANNVSGINGDCGGALACGTCHVYISAGNESRLPPPSGFELEMLGLSHNTRSNSRLACQIWLEENMSGLEVQTPESQYL